MARRTEGTVEGGFRCDAEGCVDNAIWAPILCTPFLNDPGRAPILTFLDVHVCAHHWKSIRRELATEPMREAIRMIANERGGRPDFDRMFLSRIAPFHPDFHKFQQAAGLIPTDDRMVKEPMTIKLD